MAELDTDINAIKQDKTNLPQWPALVHRYDVASGTFSHVRVENEQERSQRIKNGWFKTPLDAESSATKGKPHRTNNDAAPEGDQTPTA